MQKRKPDAKPACTSRNRLPNRLCRSRRFLKGSFELIERVDAAIADLSDTKELLASVGWHLLCRPETDCVFILLKNSDNKFETAVELSKRQDVEYAMQSGIVEQVLHDGKPVVVDDISKYPDSHSVEGKATAQSVLAVPMRNRQSLQGVIYLGSAKLAAFSPEQVNVLNYLGGHVGLALENLQLSQAARQNQKFTAAGQSAVNLSHGIKNILQAISGAAEVIDYGFEKNQIEKAKNSWEILKSNVDRLKKFTLDMLAFNRDSQTDIYKLQTQSHCRSGGRIAAAKGQRKRCFDRARNG